MRTPDAPLPTDSPAQGLERRLRLRALRASWIKDVVQAVAVTAAGIWAVYTFWYRERYLPRITDANVIIRVSVEKLGVKDGVVTVKVRTVLENPGKAEARLLATSLIGTGQRLVPGTPAGTARPKPEVGPPGYGDFVEVDRTLPSAAEVLLSTLSVREPFDEKRNVTIRPEGHVEEGQLFFVRQADFAVLDVTSVAAWLPVAFPLRKDCYTLAKGANGLLELRVDESHTLIPRGCRLSTSSASASVSLW